MGTGAELSAEVLRVAADIRQRFDAFPSPEATGNLALAYLLTGNYTKGVRLAEIRALQEDNAATLADLSAAYLQDAFANGGFDQFSRAYDAALRALKKEPTQRESLFNRSLALDGMGLAFLARQAWDAYLALDPAGPWSDRARVARARAAGKEADNDRSVRARPRALEAWKSRDWATLREIAERRPDLARETLRREAIPALARAKLEGRPTAAAEDAVRELAEIAERADRDTLDREAVQALMRGDLELAAAHVEFAGASQALDERKVDVGSPGVLHATRVFKRKGSPYAAQGELQSALVDFFHGRRGDLTDRYSAMLRKHGDRYPLLRARAHWMRALCYSFVTADSWQTLLDQRRALALLTAAGQVDSARQLSSQLLDSLAALGRDTEAETLLMKAVSDLSLEDTPLRVFVAIEVLSSRLRRKGLPLAALEIRMHGESNARESQPMLKASLALDVVELALELNDPSTAARALQEASSSLLKITDGQVRSEEEIIVAIAALGAGVSRHSPSLPDAESLISTLRRRKNEGQLHKALTLLGEERRRAGEMDLGEGALREALDILLASRARTEGEFERIKQFEEAERAADALVDLLASTGRRDEALALIERLRDPESLATKPASRPASLSPRRAVVSYWTLNDRLLASVLTSEGTRHLVLPAARSTLRNLVRRLNASMDVGNEELVSEALRALHAAVLSPLLAELGSAEQIVIVPDRDLWEVPFAGLASGRGAAPLISRYEVTFASSVAEARRPRQNWKTPRSVLAVGKPAWDGALFGDASELPESLNEAVAVAALYERGQVLSGKDATRAALLRLAPEFDIVQLATHAVANDRDPGESYVLLAPEGSDPGTWRARDPGWPALSRARLVVLSACRGGSQHSRFGGSSLGILRSIRRATSAQALVSTGDVDDAASRTLLEAFHRYLRVGHEPSASLREAQVEAYEKGTGNTWMLYRIVT